MESRPDGKAPRAHPAETLRRDSPTLRGNPESQDKEPGYNGCGQNGFEVWLQGAFTGTFNRIDDVRFWMSTNFSPSTGLSVFFKGTQAIYLQPAAGTSSVATSSVPTTDPGTANVSIGNSLSGSLTSSGYTDYVVMQLRTTTLAAAGDTSLAVFTMSYSEN